MKLAVSAAVAAVLMAGCGSDGDGDDPGESTRPGKAPGEGPASATFRARALGFTFDYPKALEASRPARRPRPGVPTVLAQVSVAEPQGLNAVKVRQSGEREYRPARYVREFKKAFAADSEGEVDVRRAAVGNLEVTVIEFQDTAPGDPPSRFTSKSHFFTGAGRTWQVECIAQEAHREAVADVCEGVLESVEFRKR